MKEFAAVERIQERMWGAAHKRAEELIRKDLAALRREFPRHRWEFRTGMYAPYVKVSPPILGETDIHEFDISEESRASPFRHRPHFPALQLLRQRIDRMSKVAVYAEDTFGADVQIVTLDEPTPPQPDPGPLRHGETT